MRDLRGKLPTLAGDWPQLTYHDRPTENIVGATLHYTAGPPGQSVTEIATYQISTAASAQTGAIPPQPFPGIAYTVVVTQDGVPNICHDLKKRTWHSGAVVNGVARNASHVGVCYTGNSRPNAKQIAGIALGIAWCEEQLDRTLVVEGHGDAMQTTCPGPSWPGWWPDVEAALKTLRGGTMPEDPKVGPLRDQTWTLLDQLQALAPKWKALGWPSAASGLESGGEVVKSLIRAGKGEK